MYLIGTRQFLENWIPYIDMKKIYMHYRYYKFGKTHKKFSTCIL